MGKVYRVNYPCPNCKEEHLYYSTHLTDEEQEAMD